MIVFIGTSLIHPLQLGSAFMAMNRDNIFEALINTQGKWFPQPANDGQAAAEHRAFCYFASP